MKAFFLILTVAGVFYSCYIWNLVYKDLIVFILGGIALLLPEDV